LQTGKVVAEVVGRTGTVDGVRLGEGMAVDVDVAVVEADAIAGKADDSFDEIERGVDGVVKDDDVAAMDGCGREKAADAVRAWGLLVDEEKIADQKGGFHRLRGDAEGLDAEGDDEDGDDDEIEIGEGWEESKVWDTEWWRRLLCRDRELERPKYLPGNVFKLGSMRGGWHGKEYVSDPFLSLLVF